MNIGSIVFAYLAVLAFFGWIGAKLFEYSLWAIFGKDVPWYLDVCGGLVLNGMSVPLAVCCAIARASGVEVPFYSP